MIKSPGSRQSHAALICSTGNGEVVAILPRLPIEQVAAKIIEDCNGDPRATVTELIAIVRALMADNEALREAASPGYARRGKLDLRG